MSDVDRTDVERIAEQLERERLKKRAADFNAQKNTEMMLDHVTATPRAEKDPDHPLKTVEPAQQDPNNPLRVTAVKDDTYTDQIK